jgi:hypothetical protein
MYHETNPASYFALFLHIRSSLFNLKHSGAVQAISSWGALCPNGVNYHVADDRLIRVLFLQTLLYGSFTHTHYTAKLVKFYAFFLFEIPP